MKRITLLFIACLLASLTMSAQENSSFDYLPFVKEGKKWNVFRSDYESGSHLEQYILKNEEIVKDGKTYMKMYQSEDGKTVVYDTWLFREEDRKVYIFDDERQEEHLMFDYSLKEGDTYDTYSYDEQKMVTYKVISVNDYQEGPEVIRYDYDQKLRRYLKKWTVCRTDNEVCQKTWIEGVGSLEGPLGNLYDTVLSGLTKDYLGYVECYDNYDTYLPFSFCDTLNRQVYGCDLPTYGKSDHPWVFQHQLTYELEGDWLHVYGNAYINCGQNQYAYFLVKPTDNPLVHKIEFKIEDAEPIATCMSLFPTDFYVPGFNPNLNYILVDNQGKEHPLFNKTYRPMLKKGKVWKEQSYNFINLWNNEIRIEGDTIVDGERYFKLLIKSVCYKHDIDANGTETYTKQYETTAYTPFQEYDRKVYRLNDGKKQLLYDFNLAVGDSHGNQTVTKIDTIAVGDNLFRRFWIEEINKEMYQILVDHGESPEKYESTWKKEGYWVEGVGSNCGLEHSSGWTNPGGVDEFISCYEDDKCIFTAEDFIKQASDDIAYRPFVEDGKVWVVRCNPALGISDASWIEYYYFDGDSIIDGHRCKIMKSVSNVNEDNWVNGVFTPNGQPQNYIGAFYEQDRKVYYKQYQQPFEQIYDFTLSSNDSFSSWGYPVVVQKMTEAILGFKGTSYDLWRDDQFLGSWLEGIGCNTSLPYISHPWDYYGGGSGMLLACTVGDEVIYLNNEYEGGVIPIYARKGRFDFTHTIKTQPRAPRKREVNSSSLYGEYNEQKLTIHLDPLYDTYLVRITDETGKAVYEKTVNTSTIVGLNIDISAYAAGRYAVTVENSLESFTGEFRILTTEIKEVRNGNKEAIDVIYNLQGQRLSGKPAKGVYIENGKKRLVK